MFKAKDQEFKRRNLMATLTRNSTLNRKGCSKCWKGVTYEHFMVMSAVVHKLVNNGWDVFTEAEFKCGGRADIVAISGEVGQIIEILHTESDARFESKRDVYPDGVIFRSVRTKDFNIDEFDI